MSEGSSLVPIPEDRNLPISVKFRQGIMMMQSFMLELGRLGIMDTGPDQYPLEHHFTPINEKYGCCIYAREVAIPKGHLIIGHIHNHPHINFLMKGRMIVATEHGRIRIQAPSINVYQEIGVKKAIYIEEDAILTTVHICKQSGEENVEKVEDELFAKDYDDLGLVSSVDDLQRLESELWPE